MVPRADREGVPGTASVGLISDRAPVALLGDV